MKRTPRAHRKFRDLTEDEIVSAIRAPDSVEYAEMCRLGDAYMDIAQSRLRNDAGNSVRLFRRLQRRRGLCAMDILALERLMVMLTSGADEVQEIARNYRRRQRENQND